jgi:hypothetical protein
MAVFTFEDLLNSQVYKSALPEDKKKLEAKYREQFGDTAETYLESAPETVVKSEGFDQLPPQEKLRMVREAKEKASIIEQDFEARRASARQDVSKDALLAQDQVIPERGWKDPVNWLAGITGGARAGLWRVGGPWSPLANASAGGISETFGQVLATETVAEAGQALGEMAAEKIGTPSAGPALALLAHMGGHATASQLFKGLRAMGYDDELASRMASITWKATESDKSLIPASRAVYEGVLDQKRMLNPVASRPHENPSTGKIDVDDIPLAASRKLSGRQMLDKVVNVNKIAEQAEAFREIVQKTVAKYISDDALAGGDQGKPLGIVDDTFIDGQFRSNARKANKRVESPRDSASTQSGRFFPNPEDFEATVDSTLKSQIGTSVGKPKENGPIRDLLEMGFASLRDKVADTKLGKKAQNLSSTYIDKEKIKNVVNNFTKYEYGKDPAFVTARDLSNNMSGRVINDARNLVKRGRYLATKHNLSHEEIDSLLRGKNTNPDLPDEVVGIVKSLRRMIDDLGVDRETYRLLSSASREKGEGSYLPRL